MQVTIQNGMVSMSKEQWDAVMGQLNDRWIRLKDAQAAVDRLCGKGGGPDLGSIDNGNVMSVRKHLFISIVNDGRNTHEDMILVLRYMSRFIYPSQSAVAVAVDIKQDKFKDFEGNRIPAMTNIM